MESKDIISIIITCTIAICGLLAYIIRLIFKSGELVKTIETLESAQKDMKSDISDIQSDMSNMQKSISSIETAVNIIRDIVLTPQKVNTPLVEHKSPIQLTPDGEKVREATNAVQLLENHWEKIQSDILAQVKDTNNPYDIQQICFTYFKELENIFTKDEIDQIKLVAYSRGESISSYNIVFGVETRNKILEKLGIHVDDIDNHNPKKHPSI